ncbi:hypothetical protein D3C87_1127270 [compost metagenome]
MPKRVSQVSAVRTLTSSTPWASSASMLSSSNISPALSSTERFSGCSTSSAAERPRIRSRSDSITSPPSTMARIR